MKKYEEHLKIEGEKFVLTPEDLSNLYDFFWMVNWHDYETLKLNKMGKWFKKFFDRIQKIVLTKT